MFTGATGFLRPNICSILFVCFSAATLAAAPQLRLSTTAVGPVYVESGASVPAQTINAFNIGDGSLNLTVTSSAPWLSGSTGAATTCSGGPAPSCVPIHIAATTAGMAAGTYTESLTLTDPNAVDSPQNVTVTVQVNGAPTTAVDLYVTPNPGSSVTASMNVNTGGTVQSAITTSNNSGWLSFAVSGGGSYTFFTPYQIRATAQSGQSGNYTGTVTLTGSPNTVDNGTINVNLHVTSQPILQISPIAYSVIQGQAAITNNVGFQNIGLGTLAITGASISGPAGVSVSVVDPATVGIRIDPTSLNPGSYNAVLTLNSNAANTAVPIPIRVYVTPQSGPQLSVGGVVDNAAFSSGRPVGSGTIAAVFGSQLSPSGPAYASNLPLPTTLAGVQVLINGTPAPLFYVDANQADIQIPFGMTAGQMVVQAVRNGQSGNQISASVDSVAPRLFALRALPGAPDGAAYGIVTNASDGTLALPSNIGVPAHPAHRGDVLTIYALGLGPVSPSVATGAGAPAVEPLARATNVQVFFGGGFLGSTIAVPSYAGLAPNFAGLYQINVTIPSDAPLGNIPVMINMPSHASNIVEMQIAATPTN
jgi:uncharacterized protein (TIGR03437 family)